MPTSKTEALFSFPYCAAAALSRGVGIDEFEPEALASEEILGLAGRTRISIRDGVYEMPVFREGEFDRIRVETDGRVLEAAIDIPLGASPRFADSDTVAAKFEDCAKRGVSSQRIKEILNLTGSRRHGPMRNSATCCPEKRRPPRRRQKKRPINVNNASNRRHHVTP